jgi:hypothetical protein
MMINVYPTASVVLSEVQHRAGKSRKAETPQCVCRVTAGDTVEMQVHGNMAHTLMPAG